MPTTTITIWDLPLAGCMVKERKKVKKTNKVRWRGRYTSACVHFAEAQWPFRESWQTYNPIRMAQGKKSKPPLTLDKDSGTEWEYNYYCGDCPDVIIKNGGGAYIIISD
ncbi:MAG: hypothetical protein ACE5GX_13010 [Thermoanaerobaculia bacterium]